MNTPMKRIRPYRESAAEQKHYLENRDRWREEFAGKRRARIARNRERRERNAAAAAA